MLAIHTWEHCGGDLSLDFFFYSVNRNKYLLHEVLVKIERDLVSVEKTIHFF